MEAIHLLMKSGSDATVDVVLRMVVEEARICFYDGDHNNVSIGFFKRLSRCGFGFVS